MKNILAENLLRFGLKNADVNVVNKLQSLSEQGQVRDDMPPADVINKANRIDPVLAKLLVNKSDISGQTVVLGDKYVIQVDPIRRGETGFGAESSYQFADYTLYEIAVAGGLPWISRVGILIAKGQVTAVDDFMLSFNQRFKNLAGNSYIEKLNNNWNDSKSFTPEVIKKAFELIQRNQAAYKKAYHKFTRSESAIKNYWKPNSNSWSGSQYKISVLNKLEGNAVKAIDLVQDTGLIQYIMYKVKNFKSDGNYPELDGKLPVAVS